MFMKKSSRSTRSSNQHSSGRRSDSRSPQRHKTTETGANFTTLENLWQRWLNANSEQPQALDRWLKQAHSQHKTRRSHSQLWSLNTAMIQANRFQQLAQALEAQFRQEDEIDWQKWDTTWRPQQLNQLNPVALWYWVGLRTDGDWMKSRHELRDTTYRERLYTALQHQALERPLSPLWLLWYGIRPQWLPLLQQRATQSGWTDQQLQSFIKKQTNFPPLWLRAQPDVDLRLLEQSLIRQGIDAQLKNINGELLIAAYGGKALHSSEEYQQGQIEIQDLASQHIAAAVDAQPGLKVWDTCAGAGGKSLAMAAKMAGKGSITATDLKPFKLDELKRRAKRAKIQNIRTFTWDGTAPLQLPAEIKKQQGFDRVLIDAPCTSAGTWRRNPDARWRFNAEDTKQLCELQQQLLNHAAESVRPGGRLVYATCSWQLNENEQQVKNFLDHHPEFKLLEQCMVGAPDEDADCMFFATLKRQ